MKIILGIILLIVTIYVVALIELWTQVGRYQAYWQRQNMQAPYDNELLYVALGDSTAQGIGASQPEKGYVGLIAEDLQKRSSQSVRTLNFSKVGANLSDALDRQIPLLEKTKILPSTVITIEIGANDVREFDSERFKLQMDELMGKLPSQTTISDIPYFGGGLHRRLEPNVKQANLIIRQLAKKHNLKVANLHQYTSDDDWRQDYAADRFHPSNYNYRTAWAPAFLEQLR